MSEHDKAPVFDRPGALERVDQDKELFAELLVLFFGDYDQSLSSIEAAITSKDANALMESAHSVKSALGNLGAMKAFESAYSLEKLGREGNVSGASHYYEQLKKDVEAFQQESADLAGS